MLERDANGLQESVPMVFRRDSVEAYHLPGASSLQLSLILATTLQLPFLVKT